MPLVQYATESDYATWITPSSEPLDGVTALLRSATFVIAWACNRNPYNDTPTGNDVAPLRDATCAQAQSWVTLGITPADAGLAAAALIVKKSSILTADVEIDTSGRLTALQQAAAKLAPESNAILSSAGLLWVAVPLGADPCDRLPTYGLDSPWPTYGPYLAEGVYAASGWRYS